MDSHFSTGTIYPTENSQAYAGLPNLQARYSQNPHQGSNTLPPLVPQRTAFTFTHDFFNHPSPARHPQPAYPTNTSLFSNAALQGQNHQTSFQPTYPQGLQQLSNNASYDSRITSPYGFNQNHNIQSGQGRLADLRPMPAGGVTQPASSTSYASSRSLASTIHAPENDPLERIHVVGSQGRRGILPSAEGRPAALTNNGAVATKAAVAPVKDSDGKFPCPHCNKTYLHAKHLKRHLLRRKYCSRSIIALTC